MKGRKHKKISMKNLIQSKAGRKYLFLLVIVVIGIVGSSMVVYSKYYASRFNKGIAVASNLYFSSDKLKNSTGHTDVNEIVNDPETLNKITVFTNSGSWSSGNIQLTFAIRNYQNNILHNEKGLDISYKIHYVMIDEPVGAEYYVVDKDGIYHRLENQGDTWEGEGTVVGGSLDSDGYGVMVRLTGTTEEYEPGRVLVIAYPMSPSYIFRETNEDQEYRLLGMFEAHTTDMKISIESAKFVVQDTETYQTSTWKTLVTDLNAYIYNIKTVGDVVLDENSATKQVAVVTWNNRYLSIDEYDDNYLYAKEQDESLGLSGDDRYYIEDGEMSSMKIMILPYTSINMTFYKTSDFDQALKDAPNNSVGQIWFENLVKAEIPEE